MEKENEYYKWYTFEDCSLFLEYKNKNGRFGFDGNGKWFVSSNRLFSSRLKQASDKIVEERLLEYAKKEYPVGTVIKPLGRTDGVEVKSIDSDIYVNAVACVTANNHRNILFNNNTGQWAEIISKPDVKSETKVKEYVHCETQEQWSFMVSKCNSFSLSDDWYSNNCNSIELTKGDVGKDSGFAVFGYMKITFQEWCDRNNYTFKIKSEEGYQNIMDIKIGDTVRCISKNEVELIPFSRTSTAGVGTPLGKTGLGWRDGLCFIVTELYNGINYNIYYGGKNGKGVYSDAVRLIKRKEPKKEYDLSTTITRAIRLIKRKEPKIESLEENSYYKITTETNFWMIGKLSIDNGNGEDNASRGNFHYIITSYCTFNRNDDCCYKSTDRTYQKLDPNSEEVVWLEACNKANKYLSKEEALSSKKEYDLSTTITRAVKEDNPNLIFEELGVTVPIRLDIGGCMVNSISSNLEGISNTCYMLRCSECPFNSDGNKTVETAIQWLYRDIYKNKTSNQISELDEWIKLNKGKYSNFNVFKVRLNSTKDEIISADLWELIPGIGNNREKARYIWDKWYGSLNAIEESINVITDLAEPIIIKNKQNKNKLIIINN